MAAKWVELAEDAHRINALIGRALEAPRPKLATRRPHGRNRTHVRNSSLPRLQIASETCVGHAERGEAGHRRNYLPLHGMRQRI